jgi:alkylhydroperoxidase family enzyme
MSARSAVALEQGVDEAALAAVAEYREEGFTPAQRAALALADAYLTSPADMTDAVRRQVAEHLTPDQVVEVLLKLTGFSSDKVMVALGLDFEEIEIFTLE